MVTAERLGHRPALDGVRGVAVALVVLAHLEVPGFASGGTVGVTLFFVLSGFLITRLLMDEGSVDLAAFYRRRIRRLLPALGVVLAVAAPTLTAMQVGAVAFYGGNWARASGESLGVLNHTWSLAIEEQFYLMWPLVLACLGRRARWVALAGIVLAVVARPVMWSDPADTAAVYFSTFTRIDAILAGSFLALMGWRLRGGRAALVALLGLCAVSSAAFTYEVGLTLVMVLSVVLVASVLDRPMLTGPVLGYLGRRSYGLYLWHGLIIFTVGLGTWPQRVGLLALSLAATEASWRLVERRWLGRARPGGRSGARSESTVQPGTAASAREVPSL